MLQFDLRVTVHKVRDNEQVIHDVQFDWDNELAETLKENLIHAINDGNILVGETGDFGLFEFQISKIQRVRL